MFQWGSRVLCGTALSFVVRSACGRRRRGAFGNRVGSTAPREHVSHSQRPPPPRPFHPPTTTPPLPPLTGDKGAVRIGRNAAVLDNAFVSASASAPASIGADCVISSGAIVRSAQIGDGAMVGMGAVVDAGASVGADAFVDAGAVVGRGVSVPAGQLWTGAPARKLRDLTKEEVCVCSMFAAVRCGRLCYTGLSQCTF